MLEKKSAHFIIRYNLRNPLTGRGHGVAGVRDEALIDIYLEALERLYAVMTAPPWSRRPPIVGSEGKTIVNVADAASLLLGTGSPFTDADLQGVPYIHLQCGNDEPSVERERLRAIAEAVHEATHVFNWRERPLRDLNTAPWLWMHEAMAVYMETVVLRDNDDFHRFLRNWVVIPETPLDTWNARYQAGMFLCYLAAKTAPEVINKIWTMSEPAERPLDCIARILWQEGKRKFSSADPQDDDLFASGYCMDSYFLQDIANAGHAGNVFDRHGERGVSESFYLSPGDSPTTEDSLDHLACRYYRLFLESSVRQLEVQLLAHGSREATTLKAELAVVTQSSQRGRVYKLHPAAAPATAAEPVQLSAAVSEVAPGEIDHLVLVVSNCGFRGARQDPSIAHDDGQQYTIIVRAR